VLLGGLGGIDFFLSKKVEKIDYEIRRYSRK
jgi:hypothetical protein